MTADDRLAGLRARLAAEQAARRQTPTPAARVGLRSWCPHLGERLEFRAECPSGWMCEHRCASRRADVLAHLGGDPDDPRCVPGSADDCQTCPGHPDAGLHSP